MSGPIWPAPLAHLSEAPDGQLRPFALGALLRWEKSRLSQHLGRMEKRDLVTRQRCLTDQRGAVGSTVSSTAVSRG
jgi:DNA-binding MarR family transcriptional regulator